MKKLISILFLFVLSLFITNGQQSKTTYVDTLKSVIVNISTESKKQLSTTENLQVLLEKSVDNQTTATEALVNGVAGLEYSINGYKQEIEERNKNDGKLLSDKFNYTPEQVKKVISTERWLNLFTILLCILYIMYVNRELSFRDTKEAILIRMVLYVTMGIISYFLIISALTLLFNKDYFIIRQLMDLYT